MGRSVEAHLFFGYLMTRRIDMDECCYDFKLERPNRTWKEIEEDGQDNREGQRPDDDFKEYVYRLHPDRPQETWAEKHAIFDAFPYDIISFGYFGTLYSDFALVIKKYHMQASWEKPKQLATSIFGPMAHEIEDFKAFVAKHKIRTISPEPMWFLAAFCD